MFKVTGKVFNNLPNGVRLEKSFATLKDKSFKVFYDKAVARTTC